MTLTAGLLRPLHYSQKGSAERYGVRKYQHPDILTYEIPFIIIQGEY